jgi:hypothetical protein
MFQDHGCVLEVEFELLLVEMSGYLGSFQSRLNSRGKRTKSARQLLEEYQHELIEGVAQQAKVRVER